MLYLITSIASSAIRLLEFMLFARAIMSWFPQSQNSQITNFLYAITEPIIVPFRTILNRFDSIRMLPIDIAFLCAFLALELVQGLLYSIAI